MLSKKNSMVTMVTDEFLENRIILQKSVATIRFIWFFWFQKCILLYIFAQVFLGMRSIRSHISLFRLGFTPTLIESQIDLNLLLKTRPDSFWMTLIVILCLIFRLLKLTHIDFWRLNLAQFNTGILWTQILDNSNSFLKTQPISVASSCMQILVDLNWLKNLFFYEVD